MPLTQSIPSQWNQQQFSTIGRRLARSRLTTAHRKILFGSGIGWAFDAMDIALISYIMVAIGQQWHIPRSELGLLASIGMAGMVLGAVIGGMVADRMGRRLLFLVTLILFGVATGLAAISWSFGFLLCCRFLAGIGLGAELPTASTYVSEFAPTKLRGRLIVVLEGFWSIGWTIAAIVGFMIVPLENGWRIAFLIGAMPALFALVVRRHLPESVQFLLSKGKNTEAEQISSEIVSAPPALTWLGGNLKTGTVAYPPVTTQGPAALFSAGYLRATTSLWVLWFFLNFAYYGVTIWMPSLLVASGNSLTKSFGYTLVMTLTQLPGYVLAAVLIERYARGKVLAALLAASAVSAGMFAVGITFELGNAWIVAAGMALNFFCLGAWGCVYAITPEQYPTVIRTTGAGWASGIGRVASIIGPLAVPFVLDSMYLGQAVLFLIFGVAFAITTLAALVLPESSKYA